MSSIKKSITIKTVENLKPPVDGVAYEILDENTPGFGIRVSASRSSYILRARFPGSPNFTRAVLAQVGSIDLAAARKMAQAWKIAILEGKDPRAEIEAVIEAKTKASRHVFEQVAEAYIKTRLTNQVRKDELARMIRREFGGIVDGRPTGPFAGRAIESIKREEIADLVLDKAADHPAQARALLHHIKRLFDWATNTGKVLFSPCASMRPDGLLPEQHSRERLLSDDELAKVWEAAGTFHYPWGPIYQMLILTGCRLQEVVDAQWSEFDLKKKLWVIPAARMKGKGTKRYAHCVPLTKEVLNLLSTLPRLNEGLFLFSITNGREPVEVAGHWRGKMEKAAKVYGWTPHDLRRTMRTNIGMIKEIFSDRSVDVRELMIAHKKHGIIGVYQPHQVFEYLDEKRLGYELWHKRLAGLVGPLTPLRLVA